MARARSSNQVTRTRRSPEEARELILASASEVLAKKGPDAAGLKDVAVAAGVSHALVSHYFGTYEGLVEAVMSRHQATIRAELFAKMAAHPEQGPEEWIAHLFEAIAHPLYGRLAAWAVLSGRVDSEGFFTRRDQGLKLVVDVLEARLAGAIDRARLERVVLVVLSAAVGYTLGRNAMWGAMGHAANAARDEAYRQELASMLAPLLAEAEKSAVKTTAKRARRSPR